MSRYRRLRIEGGAFFYTLALSGQSYGATLARGYAPRARSNVLGKGQHWKRLTVSHNAELEIVAPRA
jgi:hypothetical protein